MIDREKLSPAPFAYDGRSSVIAVDANGNKRKRGQRSCGDLFPLVDSNMTPPDAAFLALARNFLDVCERREVGVTRCGNGWLVVGGHNNVSVSCKQRVHPDILSAWQWAVAHDAELTRSEKGGA